MKALTVRQPHAQLIALGVKTIETRTKPTKYRGQLLIHAGKTSSTEGRIGEFRVRSFGRSSYAIEGPGLPEFRMSPKFQGEVLCFGAIVASCKLVDCVPAQDIQWVESPGNRSLTWWRDAHSTPITYCLTSQKPYGDFTPGRFAWLLEDIKPTTERCPACWGEKEVWMGPETCPDCRERPRYGCCLCNGSGLVKWREGCRTCQAHGTCHPIPAKGKQGLWNWGAA